MGNVLGLGRFNGLGLPPGSAAPPPPASTLSPEALAKIATQRLAANAAAVQATAAGATPKEVAIYRTAVYLAKGVQVDAAQAGLSPEAQTEAVAKALDAGKSVGAVKQVEQEVFDAAMKAGASIDQASDYAQRATAGDAAKAADALKAAQDAAKGSNTIYYVAGGLLLVGVAATIAMNAKRPQPVLAGIGRKRGKRKGRASWIR